MMTAMETSGESDEIDMLAAGQFARQHGRERRWTRRAQGGGGKVRQADDRVDLYVAVGVRRNASSGCGLFLHSDLRACGPRVR